jgi:1-acyl-sn-glycerol-3-phosphate acyltransferase
MLLRMAPVCAPTSCCQVPLATPTYGATRPIWYNSCNVESQQARHQGTQLHKEASLGTGKAARLRAGYHTSILLYRLLWVTINVVMRIVYRYRASGQANVPKHGPMIIVVNHLHLVDPGTVVCAVRRQIVTLAADKWLTTPVVRWFLRSAGSIFVNRGEVDRNALNLCLDVLRRGLALAIAPEGTRSQTAQLQRGKAGVAYVAHKANATIVPIAAWGQERLGDWRRLRRPRCTVRIGKPFRLDYGDGRLSSERLQVLADSVMVQIARMLPADYRGYYAEQVAALAEDQLPEGLVAA